MSSVKFYSAVLCSTCYVFRQQDPEVSKILCNLINSIPFFCESSVSIPQNKRQCCTLHAKSTYNVQSQEIYHTPFLPKM